MSGRVAALDGMRGVAVLLVLLFHVRLGPFGGGFVGVTVFFTLSGFLITSRMLSEVSRSGRFSFRGFVTRRIRRLAPASMLCIAGTLIATLLVGGGTQAEAIGGDTVAAVANVANWRFLAKGTSYADLFAGPSPLNHYWSLAIEEQFYLLFPLAVAAVLWAKVRRRTPIVVGVVSVCAAASLVTALLSDGGDSFYYGTDTRLFELVAGVALALAISRPRPQVAGVVVWTRVALPIRRWVVGPMTAAAVLGIVAMAVGLENGSPTFAHGGAQIAALLTVVAIVGLLDGDSPIALVCSWRPLAWVGKVSYGVYLFHWPLVALMPKRIGPVHGAPIAVAQILLSLGLAWASWTFVEHRVSLGGLLPSGRSLATAWSASAAVLVVVALLAGGSQDPALPAMMASAGQGIRVDIPVPTPPPSTEAVPTTPVVPPPLPPPEEPAPPPPSAEDPTTSVASPTVASIPLPRPIAPPTLPSPTAPPPPPVRIAVAGDSTAAVAGRALARYAARHPAELVVLDLSMAGCTVTRVATIRHFLGENGQDMSSCGMWAMAVPQNVTLFRPDVSFVFIAMMEQSDQRTAVDAPWRNVTEPDWAVHQKDEFELLAAGLAMTGAPQLWADVPYMKFQPNLDWVSDNPARTDALNAVLRNVDADRGDVEMMPYAARLNRPDRSIDTRVRPDGIHLNNRAADDLVKNLLLPLARQRARLQ